MPGAWEGLPAEVRSAVVASGLRSWAEVYDGVATKNERWRPLRPPMMTPAEYGEVTRLTERLATLVLDACRRRASTAGELRRLLDVPDGRIEFLDEAEPLTEDLIAAVRPDVLISGGVPTFVECNIDSALGGAFDSDGIAGRFLAAYRDHGVAAGVRLTAPASAVDTRFHAMRDLLGLPDGATAVVLFHMGSDYPGTQDGHTLVKLLEPVCERGRAAGLDVVVHPLEWLTLDGDGRLRAGDTVLDSVLRMFIPQEVPAGAGRDALVAALRGGTVRMFTSSAAWLLANKTTFAWLWQDLDRLSAEDAEVVRRHVPRTDTLDAAGAELAVARRHDLVLKPAGTYGGSGVVVGRETTPERWTAALRAGLEAGGHILQEYVPADRLAMHFVARDTGEVREAAVPYCVAPYLFGGRPAGAYVRFAVPDAATGSVVNLGQGALTSGLLLVGE